ncbi:Ty3/gypsy retrotransposon protein [Quillaja saponaria]|uniref:Ty3/gypsy retrotransposon protein n=1 Tax=Quillaja saponaria TaxID=32244 RepID=A0AAD7Q9W6_QUISA|nr:Ty3/gypsy retrotransposon protein [Quillaja saponaria]
MPFGLTNAHATLQELMNCIFKPLLRKFVLVFFDDILVYSKSWREHQDHLKQVLQLLKALILYVKKSKCSQQIDYLGHLITVFGIVVDPKKVEAMSNWPRPNNVKELKGFLGLIGCYTRLIRDYRKISKNLNVLSKKNAFE